MIYVCIPTTKERRPRLEKCLEAIRASVGAPPFTVCLYENEDGGWVAALQNLVAGLRDDALIFNIGDDVIIQPDCIALLAEEFAWKEANGVNPDTLLLQPYEHIHQGNIATNPFCRAGLIKRWLSRAYVHNFADNELTELARAEGTYVYVPKAISEHIHFELDHSLYDETYDRTQRYFIKDQATFQQRKAAGYNPRNV